MKRFIYHNLFILGILICFQNCGDFTALQLDSNSSLEIDQAPEERQPNSVPEIKQLKLIGVNNTHEIILSPDQTISTDELKDTEYQILAIATESSQLVSFKINNDESEINKIPYLSKVLTLDSDMSLEITVIAYSDIQKSGPRSFTQEINININKSESELKPEPVPQPEPKPEPKPQPTPEPKPIEVKQTQINKLNLKRLSDGKTISVTNNQTLNFDDFGKNDFQIYAEVNEVSQFVQFEVNGVKNDEKEFPYTSSVINLKPETNYSVKVKAFTSDEQKAEGSSTLSINFKTNKQIKVAPGPADFLFFGGFENNKPGDSGFKNSWGINWQSFPASNYQVINEAGGAFEGKSLKVKYPGRVLGSKQRIQYASDLNKIKVGYKEKLYMRYYVKFHPGFEWVLGGKMPGLAGKHDVTGGDPVTGKNGWSTRYMWRKNGDLVVYAYLTGKYTYRYGYDMKFVDQNTKKSMKLTTGKWLCLEQYIQLNDVGKNNGIIKAWLDGKQGVNVSDATFRTVNNQDTLIGQLLFSTFYGGNSNDWAPSKDTYASYDNFAISDKRIGCK